MTPGVPAHSYAATAEDGRHPAMGTDGMVSSPNAWATVAGLDVLRAGGNAVDAAITVGATLMVVAPHQCAMGSDAFWLIHPAGEATVAVNATGRSAAAASAAAVRASGGTLAPRSGMAVTVPGAVGGWADVHGRFASMELPRLLEPAAGLAQSGVPVSPYLAARLQDADEVLASRGESARVFRPGGRAIGVGERLHQPDLAATLRRVAADPGCFYQGELAERMAAAVVEDGGVLSATDFAEHATDFTTPLQAPFHGWQIEEMPPNSQGITALVALALFSALGEPETQIVALHRWIEATKIALVVRDANVTDPDWMPRTPAELLEPGHVVELARLIDDQRPRTRSWLTDRIAPGGAAPQAAGRGDTAHFAVVDREGMAVSCIQSVFDPFGSGITVPGTGIVLHNRGKGFSLDDDHVNVLAPSKRPMHTLSPAMATHGDAAVAVFGAMGAHAQAQLHLQMLDGLLLGGMGPASVTARPRWFVEPLGTQFRLLVESRARWSDGLRSLGHDVVDAAAFDQRMGHEQIVLIDHDRGVLIGASDPRTDGLALGY